jgi:2-C-methyl-D-erythritol 4-phosphate cytidylyltransferase/2-C-methyl-D-erythritol 2,4-cyclodiphosphate synthase
MITAIIPAAGESRRMQIGINKQFLRIAGQPVLTRTLLSLKGFADEFIIVCRPGEEDQCRDAIGGILEDYKLLPGGATRQDSVYAGLAHARGDYVLIHDGSRPLASPDLIRRVIAAAKVHGAAIPALPVTDTIKEVSGGMVQATLDRTLLHAVQTPQVFRRELLLSAYAHARKAQQQATDDAFLVESLGQPVSVVPGEAANLKITHPQDILRATQIIGETIRTGIGYDVHQLTQGRDLILGGVHIPYAKGLMGHSDADVLIHAIMDAMLGAAGLGDIGRHFPDTDPAWAGADSCRLLAHVAGMLADGGMRIINIDAIIIAQKPKISPFIPMMQQNIADSAGVETAGINIKATTTEGLGFVGQGEGIAAQSVCTVAATGNRR